MEMASFNFSARIDKLCKKIGAENLDAVIVYKAANVHYFSGFRGDSSILLIGKNFRKFITDGRYIEQAKLQTKNFEIIEHRNGLFKKLAEEIKITGAKILGFEGRVVTFDEYTSLKENLSGVELKSVEIDSLRQIKDAAEISCIRRACEIADKSFVEMLNFIKPNITEIEIAAELENLMRRYGSEKPAFDTIVASGIRGSLPHGTATDKKISAGEFVTMDFGAMFNGYCSDMTRTICVGKANDRQREIYDAVLDAQLHGLKIIKSGESCKAIDSAVREKLSRAGLDKYFTHALGHSLGLEIHEEPRLSRLCDKILKTNMIVTDEPGVYIEKFGGLRIEDTVLVKDGTAETLTNSPKHLIEI